jgi:glycosyltransferase involved in cell wall biosynthesis
LIPVYYNAIGKEYNVQLLERANLTKVLHVSYSSAGGAGLFANNLVKALNEKSKNYAQLLSITNKSLREAPFQDLKMAFSSALDEYVIRAQTYPTTYSFLRNSQNKKITRTIKQHKGVFHFHWMNGVLKLDSISQMLRQNAKIVWTCHDMEFFTGGCHHALDCENFKKSCLECPAVKDIFRKVPQKQLKAKIKFSELNSKKIKIILPSRWMESKFNKSNLAPFYDIEVIENFIDQKYFLRKRKSNVQSGNDKTLRLGFVSNWVENPVKNFKKLLEIVAEIDDPIDPRFKIFAVGESTNPKSQQKNRNVVYLGKAHSSEEMISFYQEMDLLVSISYGESFGLAIAEAAALGVPTITVGKTASTDLINDEVTGYVCDSYDSFKDKLKYIFKNKQILNHLGINAQKEANLRWTPEINVNKYLQVYNRLDL